jgi:hypothetical protein
MMRLLQLQNLNPKAAEILRKKAATSGRLNPVHMTLTASDLIYINENGYAGFIMFAPELTLRRKGASRP